MKFLIVLDLIKVTGLVHVHNVPGAPNNAFLLNTLKTLFRLSRVPLDLYKYILSGAIKLVPVRSSQGNLSLFEIARGSVLFSQKFQMQSNLLSKGEFF